MYRSVFVNPQGPGAVEGGGRRRADPALRNAVGQLSLLQPRPGVAACSPVPAIVVTVLALQIDLAQQVVFGIGDIQRLAVQRQPCGWSNVAVLKSPSSRPICPLPMMSSRLPSSVAITIRLWLLSLMNRRLPWLVGQDLAGKAERRVALAFGFQVEMERAFRRAASARGSTEWPCLQHFAARSRP